MVLTVKVGLWEGQKAKAFLIEKNFLDNNYKVLREGEFIYFPVKEEVKKFKVVEKKLEKLRKETTVEEVLKNKLTEEEMKLLPRTFEEIGEIIVIELPYELEKKKKVIGEAFLAAHRQAKTVLKKKEEHTGEFRLRGLEWLAGEKKKESVYRENGVSLKVDLEKVYFSSKLANERLRIAQLVKPGEEVLVMFSGCAPYPLVIAKNSLVKEVVGVELNPEGHKYGEENVKLNKLMNKIKLIQGDVRKVVPELKRKFDRILMPLPKTGEEFLGLALGAVKKKGMIHFYAFLNETDIEQEKEKILKICKAAGKKVKIMNWRKCGAFAPGVYRVVFDIKIE